MAATRLISNSKSLAQSRGNRKVAILGDSRCDQSTVPSLTTVSTTEFSKEAQGFITWLQFLTGQRVDFDIADNYGTSGDTTTQMLARVPGMIAASQAKTVIILAGTNNWGASISYAQSISDIQAIDALFAAAGWTRIYIAELPRGDSTNTSNRLSATNLKFHLRLVEFYRNLRTTPGVFVADAWQYWADPLSTTGDVVSVTYTKDGLHPDPLGAYWIAQSLVPVINALYPPIDLLPQINSDQYDGTNNVNGCLNTNPMMGGTGGSFNATGGSGTVADGWSESAGPTWTRVYSKQTLTNGKAAQQVVLGGTGTASGVSLRQVITSGNLAVGDKVYAIASVEIDPSAANISQLALQLFDNNTVTSGDFRRTASTEFVPNITSSIKGVMRTPIYTLTSSTLQLQFNMLVQNAVTPAATVRIGQVACRKV